MEVTEEDGCLRTGRPLQIIDFENRNGRKYLVLNEENLQSILTAAGDIPVSLVSICGASRQGKSFLLSFMIRYLEALLIDETDWMGWDNAKKALEGFSWRDGIDPETSGMWLWSQPFVVNSNGKPLAIILMDTQGTFDQNTTQREWATIVGLSLLTSSCMIFNCIHSFQEDALMALESYIEYGKQAMEQDGMEDTHPFQKLVFLIRDWSSPASFAYGAKGGEMYLKEKLKIVKDMPAPVKRVRETLNSCFETIECFLMPEPGEKARQKGFNGSISLLSPNFAKKLEAFVPQLLNPDEIPPKTVLGHEITAKDLIGYYKNYVEIFNGDEIPTPMGVFEATARMTNEKLVQTSKAIYSNNMKKKLWEKKFLSEKNLKTTHKNSEKKSKDGFKQARTVGGSELVDIYKKMLETAILEEYESFKVINTNTMEKEIIKAKETAIENYNENMNNELPGEQFYDDKKLKSMSATFTEEVVDEFQDMMDELDDVDTYVEELKKKLESEQNMFVLRNTMRKTEAEDFMKNLVNEIVNDYSEAFTEKVKENEVLTENDLATINEEMKAKSLADYKTHEKKGNKDFAVRYNKSLEEQLETKHNMMAAAIMQEQENKRLKCENLISDLAGVFKETMIKQVDCAESEEFLQEKNIELRAEILEKFHKKHEYKSENEIFVNFRDTLKTKLNASFENDILEKFKVKAQKSESSFTDAYDAAIDEYKREMENSTKSKDFFTDDELNYFHLNYYATALQLYKTSPKFGVNIEEKDEKMAAKLQNELEEMYENIKVQNDLKKSNTEQKCVNDVTECLKEYTTAMKISLENARNEEKLNEMHHHALENAKLSFQNKFPSKGDSSMLEKFIADIETQILETYEEILELYKLKVEEQTGGTKKAIENGKKYYHEEMAKHYSNTTFMRPAALEKIHTEVSQKTVQRCCQSGPLTEIQKEDLMASLQITFNKYEELNNMNIPVDPAIGIDLGTTYSCVGVYHKGKVEVIPNKNGKKTTPSYVAFKDGLMVVGDAAKNQAHENPENTIFDAKRIIGRLMNDEKLQKDITTWPFKVVEETGVPKIMAEGNTYYPEQISSEILKEMRSIAETYLGGIKIKKAVITVPAYFTDGQRQATIDAGQLAGLEVLKIIDEPTASAVAYKIQHMDDETRNVLIFDLGGGTFDVAVLEMRKGVIEVKSVDGDTHLGGEDFDNNLVEHCALEFQHQNGIDILDGRDSTRNDVRTNTLRTMRRVRNESEKRKIDLSSSKRVDVSVDTVHRDLDLRVTCTRDDFEKMNQHLFDKTIEITERVLKSAGKTKEEIDDIVLVGGSTRIPKVQELLKKFFNGKALNIQIDPDEAVARGAAYQAAILNGKITRESTDFNDILEVTPFSMGVEVYGGGFSIIIPKNHRIPCTIDDSYRTVHNNQTSVQIIVFQGENSVAIQNTKLGEFYLNGIPPEVAGKEEIKVKMTINDQGVLNVTAVCTSNSVTNQGLTVNEQKWRLAKETIQKLLAEGSSAGSQRRLSYGD